MTSILVVIAMKACSTDIVLFADFARIAKQFFNARTAICHPRGRQQLRKSAIIHETIRDLDIKYKLGLFPVGDPAHTLASTSSIEGFSNLRQLLDTTQANMAAGPDLQRELRGSKSRNSKIVCPPVSPDTMYSSPPYFDFGRSVPKLRLFRHQWS